MKLILGIMLGLFVLTGCGRGPDEAILKQDIQARLDETYGEGALKLDWLRRSGSAPENSDGGNVGAIVYFDAEITVRPDYNLGSWEGPGVAALTFLLGATAEGVKAANPAEGEPSTRLQLHGSLIYRREGEIWRARPADLATTGAPSSLARDDRSGGRATVRDQIAEVLAEAKRNADITTEKIVAFELAAALKNIERRLARTQSVHGLASGPTLGEYWRLARAYARFGTERSVRIANLATAGSVENVRLLRSGSVDIALVQSDIAVLALEGSGPFEREEAAIELRALASLYPEAMHVVVMANSGIQKVEDLDNRRVDLGPTQSGSRHNALAVLEAHGLALEKLKRITQSPPPQALQALRRGQIDAVFMTIGAPARLLSSFLGRNDARLVPLDVEAIDQLAKTKRGLVAFTIAPFSYPGQSAHVPTLASTALMLTTSGMPDGEAETLLRWTFEEMDFIDLGSLHGARISRNTAQEGLAIPLHDGANAYFNAANTVPSGTPNPPKSGAPVP